MRRRFVVHLARRAGEQRSLRVAVLCALAASTVVLGAWGWTIFDDRNANFSLDLLGATHATLALFYGEAPNGTVNLPLAMARLIGPLTTAGVVLETVLQFGHRRLQSAAARSMEGHIVAVGPPDRLEVYLRPIEQADGRLLAAVQTTSDESTWRGAVVVPSIASARRWTERLSVARARRVIVAHGSDEQNLAALSDLLDVLGRTEPAVPMQVEVELDDRVLSLTVAIWLAQHHEDLDIDIVTVTSTGRSAWWRSLLRSSRIRGRGKVLRSRLLRSSATVPRPRPSSTASVPSWWRGAVLTPVRRSRRWWSPARARRSTRCGIASRPPCGSWNWMMHADARLSAWPS